MLKNIVTKETVFINIDAQDKIDLFSKIASYAKKLNLISDETGIIEDLYEREQTTETYLGTNCAVPHARSSKVLKTSVFFIRLNRDIRWSDEENAKYIFLILAKDTDIDLHIDLLMAISKKILDNKSMEVFETSENADEILETLVK
ncbi:PTS sugar transporter subunit IIA [Caviibacter abscessus]|uniref:PTS sugar transporter subunit IIA n=1 Tax=Caviibacter abscessus TaxID=1766719 RepID=UPI00082C6B8C|nr:PTS sugar transporter subunit IIA [Caviibacter abscessus]